MPTMNAEQIEFLRRRRLSVSVWNSIGPLLIGGLVIFVTTMLLTAPIFLNPFVVIARLRANTLDLTTLQTMAMMLPVVFLLLCLTLLLMIFQTYRSCRRERQYLQLTEALK